MPIVGEIRGWSGFAIKIIRSRIFFLAALINKAVPFIS
jgi:hypothetical protein